MLLAAMLAATLTDCWPQVGNSPPPPPPVRVPVPADCTCSGPTTCEYATDFAGSSSSECECYSDTCGTDCTQCMPNCPYDPATGRCTCGFFADLSAGGAHTCIIDHESLQIRCWGQDDQGQIEAPAGMFASLSAGNDFTCAIQSPAVAVPGAISCWGANDSGQATPPVGAFQSVSAGLSHACAVAQDGTVACWGADASGQATAPAGIFTAVSAGDAHTCGLANDGSVSCWGDNSSGQSSPPARTFLAVAAGRAHTCALATNFSVLCWGANDFGQSTPPPGFVIDGDQQASQALSARGNHTCALGPDVSTICWGESAAYSPMPDWNNICGGTGPGSGVQFIQAKVSTGYAHSCVGPALWCWGSGAATNGPAFTWQAANTPRANGGLCVQASECASGFCVSGVCCDSACVGRCAACAVLDGAQKDGTCAIVSSSYWLNEFRCGGFLCDGTNADCPTQCSQDAQCVWGGPCENSVCLVHRPVLAPACSAVSGTPAIPFMVLAAAGLLCRRRRIVRH